MFCLMRCLNPLGCITKFMTHDGLSNSGQLNNEEFFQPRIEANRKNTLESMRLYKNIFPATLSHFQSCNCKIHESVLVTYTHHFRKSKSCISIKDCNAGAQKQPHPVNQRVIQFECAAVPKPVWQTCFAIQPNFGALKAKGQIVEPAFNGLPCPVTSQLSTRYPGTAIFPFSHSTLLTLYYTTQSSHARTLTRR